MQQQLPLRFQPRRGRGHQNLELQFMQISKQRGMRRALPRLRGLKALRRRAASAHKTWRRSALRTSA